MTRLDISVPLISWLGGGGESTIHKKEREKYTTATTTVFFSSTQNDLSDRRSSESVRVDYLVVDPISPHRIFENTTCVSGCCD